MDGNNSLHAVNGVEIGDSYQGMIVILIDEPGHVHSTGQTNWMGRVGLSWTCYEDGYVFTHHFFVCTVSKMGNVMQWLHQL